MKQWKKIAAVVIILMLGAVLVQADSVAGMLYNGYEALFYHSVRVEESFPNVNPIGLAISEFGRAAKEEKSAAEANLMLGLIYQYLDRPGTALGYLLEFASEHPEEIWVNSLIGDMYAEMGRTGEAAAHYEKAISPNEDGQAFAQAYLGLGHIAYEREEFIEAEESYRRALEESGDCFEARFALGKALYQLGEYEEAIATLEQAQLQAPRYAPLHYYLAISYEAAGLAEKAEHARQRMQELKESEAARP